jgi:hypothetical protein
MENKKVMKNIKKNFTDILGTVIVMGLVGFMIYMFSESWSHFTK